MSTTWRLVSLCDGSCDGSAVEEWLIPIHFGEPKLSSDDPAKNPNMNDPNMAMGTIILAEYHGLMISTPSVPTLSPIIPQFAPLFYMPQTVTSTTVIHVSISASFSLMYVPSVSLCQKHPVHQ